MKGLLSPGVCCAPLLEIVLGTRYTRAMNKTKWLLRITLANPNDKQLLYRALEFSVEISDKCARRDPSAN